MMQVTGSSRVEIPVKKSSFHIPSLDGLRAISFLIVFLAHAGLDKLVPGYFGLTIFFFLSGFLITTLLRMEFDKSGGISFKGFYLRRVLRIFPPFYIVLMLASGLTLLHWLDGTLNPTAVFFQIFHLSNYYIISHGWWDGRAPGTWVYWSLAVEEHFYLVFPLVYLLLRRYLPSVRRQTILLAGFCALVLVWRCVLVFLLHVSKDRTYVATDTRVDSIIFGCILAIYANPALDPLHISERHLKVFWLPLGIIVLLITFAIRVPQFEQTLRYTLQGLALIPIFVVAIRFPEWGIFRLLNLRWVKAVGLLSYSLYLLHPTVIYAVDQWTKWNLVLQGVVSLGISLIVASAIYYFAEKPCAKLRKRLSHIEPASAPRPLHAAAYRVTVPSLPPEVSAEG